MRVLYVSYTTWKAAVAANNFIVYEEPITVESRHVWAGSASIVYRSDVAASDYTDYDTNFPAGPNRVEVPGEDEAIALIVSLTNLVPVNVELLFDEVTLKDGYTTTTTTGFTPILATPYNEQGSNGQRSLVCDSTDDTAAGTGARKVLITYYDVALSGPYTELVTLSGTTAVNTAATNIAYVERLDVEEVGTQSGNVGSVWLKADIAGAGVNIGSIAPGDNETNWVHHYVANNRSMKILSVYASIKGIDGGDVHLRRAQPTVANTPEKTIIPVIRAAPGTQTVLEMPAPVTVTGPARVTLYAKAGTSTSTDWLAGINFTEGVS